MTPFLVSAPVCLQKTSSSVATVWREKPHQCGTRTKTKHPQTNGICKRFHQTIQNEFYATAFRRKLYTSLEQLQPDADDWVKEYNETRTHFR